jgi:hypothetical protein
MRKWVVIIAAVMVVNVAMAAYALTRTQATVLLKPERIDYAAGRVATSIDEPVEPPLSGLPGIGKIHLLASGQAAPFAFDRFFYRDTPTELIWSPGNSGITFYPLGKSRPLSQALAQAAALRDWLEEAGFETSPQRLEASCTVLGGVNSVTGPNPPAIPSGGVPDAATAGAIEAALKGGTCGVRSGAFFAFRLKRGPVEASYLVQLAEGADVAAQVSTTRVLARVAFNDEARATAAGR